MDKNLYSYDKDMCVNGDRAVCSVNWRCLIEESLYYFFLLASIGTALLEHIGISNIKNGGKE